MALGKKILPVLIICGLHLVYASEYTPIHTAADCCRGNGARLYHSGNGFTATPDGCKELCDSIFDCFYFSHSTRWDNCQLCSKCDFTTSGNAGKYTSWERTKDDCTADSQCGDYPICRDGYCYRKSDMSDYDYEDAHLPFRFG